MPFHLGPLEIGLIVVLVLIIFGVGKLPQVGGAIGKSIKEFRKARAGEDEEDKDKEKSKAEKTSAESGDSKTEVKS
jgi:sec-independent protein translocase protein TatA